MRKEFKCFPTKKLPTEHKKKTVMQVMRKEKFLLYNVVLVSAVQQWRNENL